MDDGICHRCHHRNPPGSRFCGQCGRSIWPAPLGPRYTAAWFQVDPADPAPRRDSRWIMIITGIALSIAGALILGVAVVISGAVSAGCGGSSCAAVDPGTWFSWLGLPFLAIGLALFGLGFWWGIRR